MRLYLISKQETYIDETEGITAYQAEMFHGLRVFRDEKEGRSVASTDMNSPVVGSIHLVLTYHHTPKVLEHGFLIVHNSIMEMLKDFEKIRFIPVVFSKIVDVNWNEDVTPKDGFGNQLPADEILWKAPADEKRTHQWQGTYYEMICWQQKDIPDEYSDWENYDNLQIGPDPDYDTFTGRISTSMMGKYPIIFTISGISRGMFIVREDLFRILEPYLNRKYFLVHDLSGPPAMPRVEPPPVQTKPIRKWKKTEVEKIIDSHVENIIQAIRDNPGTGYDEKAAFADEEFYDIPADYDPEDVKKAIWEKVQDRIRMICDKTDDILERMRLHVRRLPEPLTKPGVLYPPEGESATTFYNRLMFEETTRIRKEKGLDDPDLEPKVDVDVDIEVEAIQAVHARIEKDWRTKSKGVNKRQRAEFPPVTELLLDFARQINNIHKDGRE